MAKMLEGKVAIVTGAGRGLGRGEAIALAREGAKVVVNDLGGGYDGKGEARGPAEDVCKEIREFGGEAVPSFESVANFEGAKRIIDTAINKFGQLNILVNNAGILRDRMVFNMAEEEWDAVISVHLKGTFNCIRHACAYWRNQHKAGKVLGARIINTVSDAGLLGNVGQSNYGAAKGAIAAFSMIVAREMERYGVTSNCIAPVARTRLTTDATPSIAPIMEKKPPPGEFDMIDPENMAPLVVYLASDDAKDISGEVFRLVGDRVWFLRGWHTIDSKAKGKARWAPEELGPVIKEMMKKAPPKEDTTTPFKEAGII
jgi:NAD(P)-dependent dehydrogenase (short-subunit alcohol dehydrogenase family)